MKYLLFLLLLLPLAARAQLADDFSDNDLTQNPTWTGVGFQVANQRLQSNGPAVTGTQLQLVTPCAVSSGATWEFWGQPEAGHQRRQLRRRVAAIGPS